MRLATHTTKAVTLNYTLKTLTFCGTNYFDGITFGKNIHSNSFTYCFIYFAIAYFLNEFFRRCLGFGEVPCF